MLVALSLPPWGWWPLAFAGFALLYRVLEDKPWRRRLLLGWVSGLGHFAIGLFWMTEFTLPGGILGILFSATFIAVAAMLTPAQPGWRRAVAFPCALLLLEALRVRFPFGGVPPGGIALGQIGGPLGPAARLGGPLLLVALPALVGMARLASVALAVGLAALGVVLPAGHPTGRRIDVALVQGGGPRGFRAIDTEQAGVYEAHIKASARIPSRVDLVLWPEDVVDVEGNVADTPAAADLAAIARQHHASLIAGVVEGSGTDHFHNAAVAWSPDGAIVGRYEKVHRVPFGEWVPFRSLVRRVADLSAVPADAIAGRGPNILRTPAGRLGVAISYEVFFPDRGRNATRRAADLLLVPTNAASFKTSQMPTQEIAASRLLAVSAGRTVLQAAPTGYTAVVTHDGRVRQRSVLSRRQVLRARVTLRGGRTPYAVVGDWPWVGLAMAGVLTARSRPRKSV